MHVPSVTSCGHLATYKITAWLRQQVSVNGNRDIAWPDALGIPALVSYEYLCTLSQELNVVWSRKKTGATLLFLLNRFATAGFGIAMMLTIPNYETVLVSTPAYAFSLLICIDTFLVVRFLTSNV